jgi:Sec-independent protein translocase protein TatA
MTQVDFWMLFGLIVIGIFGIGQRIGEAADSITRKMDDLKSELKDIKSKLDRP